EIEALSDPKDPSVRLSARTPTEFVSEQSHLKLLRAVAWLVSALAVVIGVIGVLNTMVMSVLERTHEIGILRAVGWPQGRVVRMILGEAVALALAAAVVGAVGAIGMTYLLTQSPAVNGFIPAGVGSGVLLKGLGITLVIGLLGGAYPAYR